MTRTEDRTALAAAVLALLGGLLYLAGLVLDVVALARFPGDAGRVGVHTAVDAVLASTLLPGGVLLLRRQPIGRIGCIAGSSAALLATLTSAVLAACGLTFEGPGDLAMGGLTALALVVPPAVATLLLAVSAPTARWCGIEIRPT
ncbi:hypothetical protein Amsp01_010770 [Amycolatopsis sp. NBRC 101858]|uniref:hypothetical protein n=1 Tax=Amycolatopsis sp. NBRC 101858 TaxID=3032200 RepID=UPI0024A11D4C|nr:hypothetical protein [Amycolatopsis sp. NBRC 101858]GLY35053.1 hypothetical protein Amsp01_010770 [Amycolatopsis sp. NBRC 101858]